MLFKFLLQKKKKCAIETNAKNQFNPKLKILD
jgi:hypothetical protein